MSDVVKDQISQTTEAFCCQVDAKAQRKVDAQKHDPNKVLSGLGMMGLIGWSVVVPTLLGALLGHWLDEHYPIAHSWSLALIAAGLCLGCWHAWHWVSKENQQMLEGQKGDD